MILDFQHKCNTDSGLYGQILV